MNVGMLGEQHLQRVGEAVAIVFEGREITNLEVRRNSARMGNALRRLGIGVDDIVAVTMSNCPEVFEAFGGVYAIGGTALPILFVLSADECRFILEDSEAVAVVTDTILLPKVLEATEGLETLRHVIVVGGEDSERTLSYEGLLADSSPELEMVDRAPDDVAILMYTSGTTGRPKGVMLTHSNLIAAARSAYLANEVTKPQITLVCLPMAHIYGVGAMNAGNFSDMPETKAILMRWYEPEECMRLIENHKVNFFPAVPTMYSLILNHPNADEYDLSSLEDCIAGAAPLPLELRRDFTEKFGCRMRQLYGLTESAGMGAILRPSQEWRDGSTGKAYPDVELAIVDEDDNPLPPRGIGEIVIRGPHVMKGYYKLPRDTEEALRGGWLHTGDIGYLDEDGYLYITDRKKDIIIKGGENIMPVQIEEVIYAHPAVAEAAVIGVADLTYGEDIVAYVALKPGAEATPEEILGFCRERLPSFKQPREVRILDTLPKSSIGKILKRELRSQYQA
ncbi:MAG: long-chain-fatty-acid--CoA ligase, partial [Actinomycetota bacterium]|nr:long-chain-fatty-acid--CoA ligase [Actinomycetota bacterium]MDD5666910.1 long-chain-fatty-acid--CoA ligase [Actinomycetota bacterium]